MNSLYTSDIRDYIHSQPWPKDFRWEVYEREDKLFLIMYRDNWNSLTRDEQWRAVNIVKEVLGRINASGIPMSFDRIEPGDYPSGR